MEAVGFRIGFAIRERSEGLDELITATGHRTGVRTFFDPQHNIEGGVRYLKFLLESFDINVELALAGYNAGENLVETRSRAGHNGNPHYVSEIQRNYLKPLTLHAQRHAPVTQAAAVAAPKPLAPVYQNSGSTR